MLSVATITASGLATGAGTGTATISATLNGISSSTQLTVSPAVLQSIAVTPAKAIVAKGLTQQFIATGTFSDGTTQDVTSQATWSSNTLSVATITVSGLATGVSIGTSTISANLNGVTGPAVSLTVSAPALESIAVTPANPSVAKGLTQQFTATGTFSDGTTQDLTGQVTWSSNMLSVATITANGLATGVSTGTATISATLNGIPGSTVLTVSPAVLESIAVTPANPSVTTGQNEQFIATGTFSDGTTQDVTSRVAWASGKTSVATITASGLATAVGTGTSTISATLNSVTGSTVLTAQAAGSVAPHSVSFWKNNPAAWPVTSLTLGGFTYTQSELLAILTTQTLDIPILLAQQLIAAKLNVANGSSAGSLIKAAIADSDKLLAAVGAKINPKGGNGKITPNIQAEMAADSGILLLYNGVS
jgi:DNA transposition AAA+ family ATPase